MKFAILALAATAAAESSDTIRAPQAVIDEIDTYFEMCDTNGDDHLSPAEIKACLVAEAEAKFQAASTETQANKIIDDLTNALESTLTVEYEGEEPLTIEHLVETITPEEEDKCGLDYNISSEMLAGVYDWFHNTDLNDNELISRMGAVRGVFEFAAVQGTDFDNLSDSEENCANLHKVFDARETAIQLARRFETESGEDVLLSLDELTEILNTWDFEGTYDEPFLSNEIIDGCSHVGNQLTRGNFKKCVNDWMETTDLPIETKEDFNREYNLFFLFDIEMGDETDREMHKLDWFEAQVILDHSLGYLENRVDNSEHLVNIRFHDVTRQV